MCLYRDKKQCKGYILDWKLVTIQDIDEEERGRWRGGGEQEGKKRKTGERWDKVQWERRREL